MAVNIQTVSDTGIGDEALFVPWPGYTGTPTPASSVNGINLSSAELAKLAGKKEIRRITEASTGRVIYAHKWWLKCSGSNCTFAFSGADRTVGNNARGQDGDTIIVTATPDEGFMFSSWEDGSTNPVRSVTLGGPTTTGSGHKFISCTCIANTCTVRFYTILQHAIDGSDADFTVEIPKGTTINPAVTAASVTIPGWTLDKWILADYDGSGSVQNPDGTVVINGDTRFRGRWLREYNNLFMEATCTEADGATADDYSFTVILLEDATHSSATSTSGLTFQLPSGGRVGVCDMESVIQHSGSMENHKLILTPTFIIDNQTIDESDRITTNDFVDQPIRTLYKDSDGYIHIETRTTSGLAMAGVDDRRVSPVVSNTATLHVNHNYTAAQYASDWDKNGLTLRPRANYQGFNFHDTSGLFVGGSGNDIWHQCRVLYDHIISSSNEKVWRGGYASGTSASWTRYKRLGGGAKISQNCTLGFANSVDEMIDTSGDHDLHTAYMTSECSDDVMSNTVPSNTVIFGLSLIKPDRNCTVFWYLFVYRLVLCLW